MNQSACAGLALSEPPGQTLDRTRVACEAPVVAYVNDVGGMHGFGDLPGRASGATGETAEGPTFESVWEAEIYVLNQACVAAGVYTLDEFRHTMEQFPPSEYYGMPYFERWLHAVERLLP